MVKLLRHLFHYITNNLPVFIYYFITLSKYLIFNIKK